MTTRAQLRSACGLAMAVVLALGSAAPAQAAQQPTPSRADAANAVGVEPRAPTQVVVFDRQTKISTIASRDQTGAPGTASSSRPSISQDGGFVAFQSDASLVTGDADRETDVYLWDRSIDGAQLVSRRPGGGTNGNSRNPSIAADASIVAFASNTTNLTGDAGLDSGRTQVFAWQRLTGTINLVSADRGGAAGAGNSGTRRPGDGRVVAFESTPRPVTGDTTASVIFLRDLTAARRSGPRVSEYDAAEQREPPALGVGDAAPSRSIRSPAAWSTATPADPDVFVRDLPPAVLVTPPQIEFGSSRLATSGRTASPGERRVDAVTMAGTTISGTNAGDFVVAGDT